MYINQESQLSSFWKEYGKAYIVFSQFCHYGDCQAIVHRIANEIDLISGRNCLSIIDIGTGYGLNILKVLEILFSKTRKRHLLDVVEPSEEALLHLNDLLSREAVGGFLREAYHDISEIKKNLYDVIVIMHSSYYIEGFNKILIDIYKNNLRQGGKIIILALPDSSPFFLGHCLRLDHTSNWIKTYLGQQNIDYKVFSLQSRFIFPKKFLLTQKGADSLYTFMTRKSITKLEFLKLLKPFVDKGIIDFGDELIIIDK